jgi:hypothetical protein
MKASLCSVALCVIPAVASAVYSIHHRVHHDLPYAQHSSIHITDDGAVSFQPASSLAQDLAVFADSSLDIPLENLYYQLALQRGDEEQAFWDFTSVKAVCILLQ